ncbi:MAG: hypothetical protein JW958_11960 [Candidatus Eisenbacteria bacterium]|nr:hypothetical protein [Candidatus Eisenbacteria bacterium]
MKKALVLAAALFATASLAFGAGTCELDLDAVVGNGPDFIIAEVSDYIVVDIYMMVPGVEYGQSIGCIVGNFDGSLEYQGCVYHTPPSWAAVPPAVGEEITVQATSWGGTDLLNFNTPILVATLTFHAAADCSVDDLVVISGGVFDMMLGQVDFDVLIGGTVQIGTSATEEASWGAVKGLFR